MAAPGRQLAAEPARPSPGSRHPPPPYADLPLRSSTSAFVTTTAAARPQRPAALQDNPDSNRVTDWPVHSYPDKCPTGLTSGPTRTAGPGVRSRADLCPTLRDQLAIQWSFQMGFGHEVWEVTTTVEMQERLTRHAWLL